jgi:hypothetical protein
MLEIKASTEIAEVAFSPSDPTQIYGITTYTAYAKLFWIDNSFPSQTALVSATLVYIDASPLSMHLTIT